MRWLNRGLRKIFRGWPDWTQLADARRAELEAKAKLTVAHEVLRRSEEKLADQRHEAKHVRREIDRFAAGIEQALRGGQP